MSPRNVAKATVVRRKPLQNKRFILVKKTLSLFIDARSPTAACFQAGIFLSVPRNGSYTGKAVLSTGDLSTKDECTPLTPSIRVSLCRRNC